MLPSETERLGPEEYLRMERKSEIRHEYMDGELFAMTRASFEHNQISANIVRILGNQFLEKPCYVFSSDMKVRIPEIGKYTYPDIVVACEEASFEDDNNDALLNPIAIFEILSDSTEAHDRGKKFAHYRLMPSLAENVLVSQHDCLVEKFWRRDDHTWIYGEYRKMEHVPEMDSFDCSLSIVEMYRKVEFRKTG